jgi:putative ABC transport system permease protein
MVSLARRNLFHDKIRLAVTLTGVVFAVVLIAIQLGMFIGFASITSHIIDRSKADLWVATKDVQHIEVGVPFSESKLYQVLATPGVAHAEKYIVQFGYWRRPDGAAETALIVGFNPDSELGGPWDVVAGNVKDLRLDDTIMVDELYRDKLGVTHIGQVLEIRGKRARVVGFTRGIRTFTTAPTVFTSFKNALNYERLRPDQTYYVLVKAAPGVDPQELKQRLAARLDAVDVYTTAEWSLKNQLYWVFGTGAGVSVLIAAVLGLVVGVVVVAQTIYSATIDHLREFGTLKAMGASNGYIYRVIINQAVISAVIGYVIGMTISFTVIYLARNGAAALILPWQVAVGLFGLTLLMCVSASAVSINKITRIDPAMVFKG